MTVWDPIQKPLTTAGLSLSPRPLPVHLSYLLKRLALGGLTQLSTYVILYVSVSHTL